MQKLIKEINHMAKEYLPKKKYDHELASKKGGKKLCKADMHVHTWYSKEYVPGGKNVDEAYDKVVNFFVYWFNKIMKVFHPWKVRLIRRRDLKTFSIYYRLRYTPLEIVKRAKRRGLSFVAITDHNSIEGWQALLKEHPELEEFVIKGEEVSIQCYKTGIKAHMNVFELNEKDHHEIHKRTKNLPRLVKYLKSRKLLYSLNHIGDDGCWIRRKITPSEVDKYFKYFNVIEVRNGLLLKPINLLNSLLAEKKKVSVIAGTDSHANNIGETYVAAYANSKKEFLNQIRKGKTYIGGRHGSLRMLTKEVMDRLNSMEGVYFNDKQVSFDNRVSKFIAKFMRWFIRRNLFKMDESHVPGKEKENVKVLYNYVKKLY